MTAPRTIIGLNYHRIGPTDPARPLHRLHGLTTADFTAHLDYLQQRGRIVSPDQVRAHTDLGEVNFVVCFDDVPVSATAGIALMLDRGLPLTLSPCGQLADHGWGTRDKVYLIEALASPDLIQDRVRVFLDLHAATGVDTSFYHLTKSDAYDPALLRADLIDPLFEAISGPAAPHLGERAYLSWDQLRRYGDHPLVTVANHTLSHDNLAALSTGAVRAEINRSHDRFASQMGWAARYFTVPFGRLTQEVALDCLEPLATLGYTGMLWVGGAGILTRRPYHHQILHLPRLHAEPDPHAFRQQVEAAIDDSLDAAIWQVPPTRHRRPIALTATSDPHRSALVESLLRQGKDYTADPAFYRHQFTDNPYKNGRPDYYTAETDGRIEATAYNFHTAFALGDTIVPGVYLSSWRKLPHAHPVGAARLLQTMTSVEPVVGVYHPNPAIHHAFTGWQRASVHHLTIPTASADLDSAYRAEFSSSFPDEATDLCATSVRAAGFTVARDRAYQEWRHGTYPLASVTYLLLTCGGSPAAVVAIQHTDRAVRVADFHLRANGPPDDATHMIVAVLAFADRRKAAAVEWETSSTPLARLATAAFGANATTQSTFYYLNPGLLQRYGAGALPTRWPDLPLHETGTCGDVLLRP